MNARLSSTLALVLFATGCAGSEPEDVPTPPADSAVETTAVDTAVPDTATEDTAPETSVDASLCGNTFVNTGEECDDGNTTAGDGCSPSCMYEPTSVADVCDGESVALTVHV